MTPRVRCICLAIIALLSLACGGAQTPGSARDRNDAVVTLEFPVANASLWVDGKYVRQFQRLKGAIALSPGTHFLEVRHDDYHTFYLEIALAAREQRTVPVELAEILR